MSKAIKGIFIAVILLILLFVSSKFFTSDQNSITFEKGILETDYFRAEITDYEFFPEGTVKDITSPSFAIKFRFTNKSNTPLQPDMEIENYITCEQNIKDTAEGLNYCNESISKAKPEYKKIDNQASSDLKPGKSTDCYLAFEVIDIKNPVFLVINDDVGEVVSKVEFQIK